MDPFWITRMMYIYIYIWYGMICCHDYLTSMKWGYLGEVNIYIYIYIYLYICFPNFAICYGGFLERGYLQFIYFDRIFHYEPSIMGCPHFWGPPCISWLYFPNWLTTQTPIPKYHHGGLGQECLDRRLRAAVLTHLAVRHRGRGKGRAKHLGNWRT